MCGGGVSNQGTGLVELDGCILQDNTAYHTGVAVDNLTVGSKITVQNSIFKDNQSNVGSICGGPHGQITIFKNTVANVQNCDFSGTNYPIDAAVGASVEVSGNTYNKMPVQPRAPGKEGNFIDKLKHARHQLRFSLRLLRYGLYPWVQR
jgi:hypothetical protein